MNNSLNIDKMCLEDSLKIYLNSIDNIDVLTQDDEQELGYRALQGDEEAKKRLVEANLRLVISIARKYANKNDLLDLIQAGNVGLIKAASSYDVTKKNRFSTYATLLIKQSVIISKYNQNHPISLSYYILNNISKIKKFEEKYIVLNHREPSLKDISKSLGISEKQIMSYKIFMEQEIISLDSLIGEDCELPLIDSVKDNSNSFEKDIEIKLDYEKAQKVIKSVLTEREKGIINLRSGVYGTRKTLEEVGRIYGLSRERTRRIELAAYEKIRNEMKISLSNNNCNIKNKK